MKRYALWILPCLLAVTFLLEISGILHISYLHIKSHDLKWTLLDYGYYDSQGKVYTIGETVHNFNYEDALIAVTPSYDKLLAQDVALISEEREYIDYIDPLEKSLYSDKYRIQLCLDYERVEIKDTTIFRKIADLEILGYYELYNRHSGELIHNRDHKKWWIRDKVSFYGVSRRSFIENKLAEMWLAQVSNETPSIMEEMERVYLPINDAGHMFELADWASQIKFKLDSISETEETKLSWFLNLSEEP